MTALLLRLAAPMQAWGTASRFTRRDTDHQPSKSAIIGLLAASQGRRRTEPLEELLNLKVAVRTEQPGRLERDFQTAARTGERTPVSVSNRYHLADAVFLAAIEGEDNLLDGLRDTLRRPHFPLFLGRRACPPAGRLEHGLRAGSAIEVLQVEPWHASPMITRRRRTEPTVALEMVADCVPGTAGAQLVRDEPVSFDPRHRQWEWRSVARIDVPEVPNPSYRPDPALVGPVDPHDPMAVC